jgi:hypothetical protein
MTNPRSVMKSIAVRGVLLWTAAAACAIAAVISAVRDNVRAGVAIGIVALVFAVIAVAVRGGSASSGNP